MDPQIEELKQLVRQNTALTQETHAMVKSMHRAAVWGKVGKFLWIGALVALSVGAYVYFAPYIEQMMELYQSAQEAFEQAKQLGGRTQ
jgi:hypothetical protein